MMHFMTWYTIQGCDKSTGVISFICFACLTKFGGSIRISFMFNCLMTRNRIKTSFISTVLLVTTVENPKELHIYHTIEGLPP